MDVITLREDYFCSNTYLLIEGNEAIIVDAGASLNTIKNAIEKYNVKYVLGIFITHAHFDHILSLEEYINYFNCKAYIGKIGKKNLKDTIKNYSAYTEKVIVIESSNILELKDKEKVCLGCFEVETIYTPGHTDDSVCYIVDEIMFTGDTVFDWLIGRTDLVNSSEVEMKISLRKLFELSPYQVYFPGHGRKSTKESMQAYLFELNNQN